MAVSFFFAPCYMSKKTDHTIKGLISIQNIFLNLSSYFMRKANKVKFEIYKTKFGERKSDIYIATYPKSGTTLMQMILYQLTTDGNMDFHHIYEVSPWIKNAAIHNEAPLELPSPRIIKTHDGYNSFAKGTKGKFIYIYRNPEDVAISQFHQNKNYNLPDIGLNDFIYKRFLAKGPHNWFMFNQKWLRNKRKLDILYVRYEDLLADKLNEIGRVVKFLKIKPPAEAVQRAMERSSFEYMKEHEAKFGLQAPAKPDKVYDQFIRKGQAGEGKKELKPEHSEQILNLYNKEVKHYETLRFSK